MATHEISWDELLDLHDNDDALVALVDTEFVLRAASRSLEDELELERDAVIGASVADLVHPDDLVRALDVFSKTRVFHGLRPPGIYRIKSDNAGNYRTFDVTGETLFDGEAVVMRLRRPSQRARSEVLALEQVDVFEMLGDGQPLDDCLLALTIMVERNIDNCRAVIHVADDAGRLRSVTSSPLPSPLEQRFAGRPVESPGDELQEALERELTYVDVDPERHAPWPRCSATPALLSDGSVGGYLEVFHPDADRPDNAELALLSLSSRLIGLVVDRHTFETRLADAAYNDALTGLGNRRALANELTAMTADGGSVGVLAIDLDQFAAVNNNLGHQAGDEMLKAVAASIVATLPEGALAFRPGGDEFLVAVPGERRSDELVALGERILAAFEAEPIDLDGIERRARASIGVARSSRRKLSNDELLAQADTAMYAAKRNGGNSVRLHSTPLNAKLVHRRALADALPHAIAEDTLHLDYQPVVSLDTSTVVGFEALVRWDHPTFGVLGPDEFVPIAEESSVILRLDEWVLETAAAQVAAWNQNRSELDVWVNLSARSLAQVDLADRIVDLQQRHGVCIGIELTERDGFVSTSDAEQAFERLRFAGVNIALDDFGTGRSSLFRAVFHDPTVLKIDRSFVAQMLESHRVMVLVETILDLARRLDLTVIAEGVETIEQMETLRSMGCDLAQGYLFSPAIGAAIVERRLGTDFRDLRLLPRMSAADKASDHLDM